MDLHYKQQVMEAVTQEKTRLDNLVAESLMATPPPLMDETGSVADSIEVVQEPYNTA